MAGGRKKVGDKRIDAAIDHFVLMGFKKVDVRNVVNSLLRNVYGNDGWPFLEENCYHVVQEALLEKQEQEEKLQLQLLQNKQQEEEEEQQQNDDDEEDAQNVQEQEEEEEWEENDEAQHVQEQQQDEWEEDDEAQQQAEMMGAPSENNMSIVKVHNEVPSEAALAAEQTEEVVPMIINPPAPNAALPRLAATGTGRTRRPCYGWISESESDSDYEEFLASRRQLVRAPNAGGDRAKRKRPSRWDVESEAA